MDLDIQQIWEFGVFLLSLTSGAFILFSSFTIFFVHPRHLSHLVLLCNFCRRILTRMVSSDFHQIWFIKWGLKCPFRPLNKLITALTTFDPDLEHDSLEALKTIVTAPGRMLHATFCSLDSGPAPSIDINVEHTVTQSLPNLWIDHNHSIYESARALHSVKESGENVEAAIDRWNFDLNKAKMERAPKKNVFQLDLECCQSFGAETLLHFRFFKIMAVVTVLSALPLLYNAFYISGGLNNDILSFSLSDFNLGNMSDQTDYTAQCFFPAPLYLFPALCDFDGLIPTSCFVNVSKACPVHWDNPTDFWSSLLTIFIGAPQNCAPPSGTWMQDEGYCQCSSGFRGTVCRTGQPPTFTYGVAFMASTMIGVLSWIWMVRDRIALRNVLRKRICPQERDFSILIQDLPPNSHLNREELSDYLITTFGSIKFISFAFDDRNLYDSKHNLSCCKEELSHLVTSSHKDQEKYFLKVLSQNQISLGDFEISCDFDVIKSYKFQPNPKGWLKEKLSSLFPHPSIGFVLPKCFKFIYRYVHGENNLPASEQNENNCCCCLSSTSSASCSFPEVLKIHPQNQSPVDQSVFENGAHVRIQGLKVDAEQNGRSGVIQGFVDVATGRFTVLMDSDNSLKQLLPENMQQITYHKVSQCDYYGSKCSNMIQWNALKSAMKILPYQDKKYQNSGTAIVTFCNVSSQQAAVRIATRVACQGKDQPKNTQDRSYTYYMSISEVDQPEDVIWRNFGVSIFNKFGRFIASLSIAFFFIIVCSVLLAVLMQIGNCKDPIWAQEQADICSRYTPFVTPFQNPYLVRYAKNLTGVGVGFLKSVFNSLLQAFSVFLSEKIETPSSKSQKVLFSIGRNVFISFALLYCPFIIANKAPGSPAYGYNKKWLDESALVFHSSVFSEFLIVLISVVGSLPFRSIIKQAIRFSTACGTISEEQALQSFEYDIITVTQFLLTSTILSWILAPVMPLFPIFVGSLMCVLYVNIKSAQAHVLRPNKSGAIAAPILMELFGILAPAIGIAVAALIWFPFSDANYFLIVSACGATAVLGPIFFFIVATSLFKLSCDYQFHRFLPFIGRRGFRDVFFKACEKVLGMKQSTPVYDVAGNLAKRVFPRHATMIDKSHTVLFFWRPRFYWYQIIETNPAYGFRPNQLVAMKVSPSSNGKTTVYIIPTLSFDNRILELTDVLASNQQSLDEMRFPEGHEFKAQTDDTPDIVDVFHNVAIDEFEGIKGIKLEWRVKPLIDKGTEGTKTGCCWFSTAKPKPEFSESLLEKQEKELFSKDAKFCTIPSIGDEIILLEYQEIAMLVSQNKPQADSSPKLASSISSRCKQALTDLLNICSEQNQDAKLLESFPIDAFYNLNTHADCRNHFQEWPTNEGITALATKSRNTFSSAECPYLPLYADQKFLFIPSTTESEKDNVPGPYRKDINIVEDYDKIDELEIIIEKTGFGRGKVFEVYQALKRIIIKIVQ